MTTQALAELSNNALYSATVVYALAMLAHVAEWAMARDLPADASVDEGGRPRAEALRSAQRSLPQESGSTRASESRVGVGGGSSYGTADSGVPTDHDPIGSGRPLAGSGADTGDVPLPMGADVDLGVERSDRFGRIGLSLTILGLLLQLVGVVARGLAAERAPWGSMYEFAITGSLLVAIVYVVLVRRYDVRWLGLFVTAFLTVVLGIAVIVLYRPVAPLVPALHSYWLVIHVFAAALAGGAFTLGAGASVLYLLRRRAQVRASAGVTGARRGFIWRTPSADSIDRVAYRLHAFAFPLWTFAVLAGAIWAEYAWGRYWGWDPKEVWAFITWVVYAAYLHARATSGWKGRSAAVIALVGFTTFLFNFVGINLFGSGLHAYSGF